MNITKLKWSKSNWSLLIVFGMALFFLVPLVWANDNSNHSKEVIGVSKSSMGEVQIDLTPIENLNGELVVEIIFTTHNVNDLHKYDLKAITHLEYSGKTIKPSEVPRLGGHHPRGKIIFSVDDQPKKFKITIADLHDQGIREFSWP